MGFYKKATIILLITCGFSLFHFYVPNTGLCKVICIDQKVSFQEGTSVPVTISGLLKIIKWQNKKTGEDSQRYELEIDKPICDGDLMHKSVVVEMDEGANINSYLNRRIVITGEVKRYAGMIGLKAVTVRSEGNSIRTASENLPDGLTAIEYCLEGSITRLEREKREEGAKNKYWIFHGTILEIMSGNRVWARIGKGHYANVYFANVVGSSLRKEQAIKFKGALTFIGTGILVSHTIRDATIITERNERNAVESDREKRYKKIGF